jgi:hypothetical protein
VCTLVVVNNTVLYVLYSCAHLVNEDDSSLVLACSFEKVFHHLLALPSPHSIEVTAVLHGDTAKEAYVTRRANNL